MMSYGAALPDPGRAEDLDGLVEQLRALKVWAGDPSYETIALGVNDQWRAVGEQTRRTTVADCFRSGRRRINSELVLAIVRVLHPDEGYVSQWRQALRVVTGEIQAAAQVRVQAALPERLADFSGRKAELDQLVTALAVGGTTAVVVGMPGIGKTQLAVQSGHVLAGDEPFEQVLFVNLRGFHPDRSQPPADPAAVLDGFLRLLGVPGSRVPHSIEARVALYRERLAGVRALVVLDNAASEEQVLPLLPESTTAVTLVTSRRSLDAVESTVRITVDGFTAAEATGFLLQAAPAVPAGADPEAPGRIALRCGYLPLALGLVAGYIRTKPGWTLTDHADRLDERRRDRRLEDDVESALDLSYRDLPDEYRRLLRLTAQHPGQDFDQYGVAALCDLELPQAQEQLRRLHRDHLLQLSGHGQYTFHDLVRSYASLRALDEDAPPVRRAALTRLFDYYLATCAVAMDTLYPSQVYRRPEVPPSRTPVPELIESGTAREWLDTERPNLIAVVGHAAANDWPAHAITLSRVVLRYLDGTHAGDAMTVHSHALRAAESAGDETGQAHALNSLAITEMTLGIYEPAVEHLKRACVLFERVGEHAGRARALTNLGSVEERLGRYESAADHLNQALQLYRGDISDLIGEAGVRISLGDIAQRLGHLDAAAEHLAQGLALYQQAGDPVGQAHALNSLAPVEQKLGQTESAVEHLELALVLCRQAGHRGGEAGTLDNLAVLFTSLGRATEAVTHHEEALLICREVGDRGGETWALNGLGEAVLLAGRPAEAITHHTAANALATELGVPDQQARAHAGLGHAHTALNDPAAAQHHYQMAYTLYTTLNRPEANDLRSHLTVG
ncbi:tetratricopeptide repeat protein [Kribbella sp. CA-294648]|uniref:tetratricopeptide repeat protein n=1 Tax=Kribbella sp. CA-294648 TaxID=3239948 RepID=UPI003D8F67A8